MRLVPFALLVLTACGAPPTSEAQLPSRPAGVDWLVLIIHGSGDSADAWPREFAAHLQPRLADPARTLVVTYDWAEAAQDKLSAADRGEAEGQALARALAPDLAGYQHLHVIAHSVGAHVAHGLLTGLRAQPTVPTLHVTFLDPFVGRGVTDWTWGVPRFGTGADFAEAWMNVGDGAPATDDAPWHAHAFDVSAARPASGYEGSRGHWWPIEAYRDAASPGLGLALEVAGHFSAPALASTYPPAEGTTP